MKNVRVKVRKWRCSGWWDFAIYDGRVMLFYLHQKYWKTEKAAIRNAKVMAKRISIKYDPEIIKQRGC